MTQNSLLPRQFAKITLTLENCLLSDNKLQETPSQQDGLDKETETDLRILGCELIQISGILLKLPQVRINWFLLNSQSNFIFPLRNHEWDKQFLMLLCDFAGSNGHRTSVVPAVLLFKIVSPAQYGDNSHELHILGIQNWGGTTSSSRRH